jgi:hypothetical protein
MLSFTAMFLSVIFTTAYFTISSFLYDRKLRRAKWTELVDMLLPVPNDAIRIVATDHLQPTADQITMEPHEMWQMLEEFDGLASMYFNTRVLCALAAQAEAWNHDEAHVVAERMRMEAWTVRMSILQVVVRFFLRSDVVCKKIPFLVQQATSSYYLMSNRVLSLYEASHFARMNQIQAAM